MHYRGIEILNKDFNKACGEMVIPALKLTLVFDFVCSIFACVRFWSKLDVISTSMLFLFSLGGVILIIPMSMITSSLFDISNQFKWTLLSICGSISDRATRKHCSSQREACSVIRCQVGGLYYMEARAKLTLLQHVINGVVCLLVNTKV